MSIKKHIVIYGGTLAGVAAAAKAAKNMDASTTDVTVIVPDPVDHNGNGCCLGGLATVGGQNFFDIGWKRVGKDKRFYTKGSFNWWYSQVGQHYNPETLSNLLKSDLTKPEFKDKINILYGYDIKSIGWAAPANITEVRLCQIDQDTEGRVIWGTKTCTVPGTVFIDASESGRLTRMSNFGGTTGRYDWPAKNLDASEQGSNGRARQQAATLMFKVTKFNRNIEGLEVAQNGGFIGVAGGKDAYMNNAKITQFNDKYGPQGFVLKPFNMAQDGAEGNDPMASEWWVNMLLVFNVDGRAYNRDKGTNIFPKDMRSDYMTVDDAYVAAKKILECDDFLSTLRSFPGFETAELVKDSKGKPVVAKSLYLRETIHSAQSSSARANGTENNNYALRADDFRVPGSSKSSGYDARNYAKRIGLNFYPLDINAYKFEDLKKFGNYIWGHDVTMAAREGTEFPDHSYATYISYDAIATNFVYNLLIPGYAAGISSLGWSEARTLPNQCVLGDAAGVAAAYATKNGKQPLTFNTTDIANIQSILANSAAMLEKTY